jgi:hypothetical protein
MGRGSRFVAMVSVAASICVTGCGSSGGSPSASSSSGGGATGGGTMFQAANIIKAVNAIKAKLGPTTQLTGVTVTPVAAEFDYRVGNGDEAQSITWDVTAGIQPPQHLDTSSLKPLAPRAFSISTVDPSVVPKLVANAPAVAGSSKFHVTSLGLARQPAPLGLGWQVVDTDDPALGVLTAKPDGSDFKNLG